MAITLKDPPTISPIIAGHITHFEAMQAFFHFAPFEPRALDRLLRGTKPHPQLADCVRREANGWDLIIVSAGCVRAGPDRGSRKIIEERSNLWGCFTD